MENKETYVIKGLEAAIVQAERAYKSGEESMDILMNNAKTLFGSCAFIVAFAAGLKIVFIEIPPGFYWVYLILIAFLAGTYIAFIVTCLCAMQTQKLYPPFGLDYRTLTTHLCKPEKIRLAEILNSTLKAIEKNRPIVEKRYFWVKISSILMAVIVILLIGIAALPKG